MNKVAKYATIIGLFIIGAMAGGFVAECGVELVCGAGLEEAVRQGTLAIATGVGIAKVVASEIVQAMIEKVMPTPTLERTA